MRVHICIAVHFCTSISCDTIDNISVQFTKNSSLHWTSPAVVFCIDDDEATLEVLKSTVETHGYSVLTCSNWQSAMDIFKRNTIDLVIVDYEMPPMSGYEVSL